MIGPGMLMTFLLAWGPLANLQDPAPSEKEARKKIDARLQQFAKSGRKAGLGLLKECIQETLAFGVPAYNAGDRAACARSYVKTAESLCAICSEEAQATAPGWRSVSILKGALTRAQAARTDEDKAWAIRYGFDRVLISWDGEATRLKALLALGNVAEAMEAYRDAAELTGDIVGQDLSTVDLTLRGAWLMAGHCYLAEGRFKEASQAILAGLQFVPEFPKNPFDLRSQFRADRYEQVLEALKSASEEKSDDADLAFLLGYVHHHSGRKDEARAQFDKLFKRVPDHPAAKLYGSPPPQKKAADF